MKIDIVKKVSEDIKYLRATMGVRYWVDCEYGFDFESTLYIDFPDTEEENERIKNLTPCVVRKDIGYKENDYLELIIDIDEGKVLNWPYGFCLNTRYKVCDDGEYVFLDENKNEVINITKSFDQYYVPDFLALEDNGYGDYVIINIDGNGKIEHFDKMKSRIDKYFKDLED